MIGETILHYKILEKLGEGGMGEVYKAQDTKLDRFVALKFLPSQLIASEDDKARFIQEAKAASAMNHPNVCTIYDIQEFDGQLFIVMEYVDGKTLKDKKESLSEKQILEIGIQAAEGLAAAHEKGIVHRDIKPENIMIRKDGIVQIMDFGLAKLYKEGNVSRLTKAGTTMGTMGYMSPEQVQGLDVDHRTDIFSLGVVLYELLAGESPFKGMHETAIMYEIVNVDPPPISTVKEGIDPEIDEIILECLEKDKDERCQSAKELAKDLRKVKKSTGHRKSRVYNVNTKTFQTKSASKEVSKSSGSITIEAFNKRFELGNIFSSKYLSWGLAGILLLAVLYFAMFNKPKQQTLITSATSINAPGNVNILGDNSQISHNGKYVVFAAIDSAGNWILWLRPINSTVTRELTKLNGSRVNGSLYPFWSSDDKYIFYFYGGKLKKLNIISGTEIDICDVIVGRGGTMNKNGDIVFAPNSTGGLYLVSANGGTPREVVKADSVNSEESLRFPYFLPDGVHFLYTIQARFSGSTAGDEVIVGSMNSDIKDTVMQVSSNSQYANGYLFFVRQSILMCQAFDQDNFKLSGDIYTISGNINFFNAYIYAAYSVSDAGNLIFQSKSDNSIRTVLVNDKGNKKEELLIKNIQNVALFSPDGTKIIYDALSADSKNFDIWMYDINRQITNRFTFSPNIEQRPIWSYDGKYIAYISNSGKTWNINIKKADGTGSDSLVYQSDQNVSPSNWSSDDRYISFTQTNPKTLADIGIIDLKNNNTPHYFLKTEFNEYSGLFSNNMKWIMYGSNESGKSQVYVQPFLGNGGRRQISNNGGYPLRWVDNDRSIIYVWQNEVFKVNVDASGQNFVVGKPELLFNTLDKNIIYLFDVTKDGKTYLGGVSNGSAVTPPFTYIQNWKGLLNEDEK
jgi:serine/threonine protein kinase